MDDVHRAEEALVGSVVLAPECLGEVAGWLRPADFGSPACRLLFDRLLQVRASGAELNGASLLEVLRERGELRSDGYPILALTRWFDAVPSRPSPGAYGALVVEGALARQVQAAGTRLVQASGRLGPARALVAAVTQRSLLGAARRRWETLPATVRRSTARSAHVVRAAPAGRPARRDERLPHAELVTVGALLVAPHLGSRVRWLEPEDFTSPDAARVFAVVRAMTAAGVAVDPVTVGSELHRSGVTPNSGEWGRLLARAEAAVPVPGSVGFYGRQVLDASVVGGVAATGRRLLALGQARRGGATVMLDTAVGDLERLGGMRQRWRRSRQVSPARPIRPVLGLERPALARVAEPHVLDRSIS